MLLTIAVKLCSRKDRTGGLKKWMYEKDRVLWHCAAIMNHYKVDAVPHFICGGFSKNETEDALIDLNFLGVDNVLVLGVMLQEMRHFLSRNLMGIAMQLT